MKNPHKAIGLGALSAGLAGLICLTSPQLADAGSYGMGPGMMGASGGSAETSQEPMHPAHTESLRSYLHESNLGCLQCHGVSGRSFGPSFSSIATKYENQANAVQILSQHIAHGIGRMPPGFASDAQAEQLARLILDLQRQE